MTSLTVGQRGEIALPAELRERYGLRPDTPVRIIETRSGILLVPMTDEPMSADLEQELAEWQSHSANAWEMFPYEDGARERRRCLLGRDPRGHDSLDTT